MEKAGLAWKLRGYPYAVNHKVKDTIKIIECIEWCNDTLAPNSAVWAGHGQVVFRDEASATIFKLTWCYD